MHGVLMDVLAWGAGRRRSGVGKSELAGIIQSRHAWLPMTSLTSRAFRRTRSKAFRRCSRTCWKYVAGIARHQVDLRRDRRATEDEAATDRRTASLRRVGHDGAVAADDWVCRCARSSFRWRRVATSRCSRRPRYATPSSAARHRHDGRVPAAPSATHERQLTAGPRPAYRFAQTDANTHATIRLNSLAMGCASSS